MVSLDQALTDLSSCHSQLMKMIPTDSTDGRHNAARGPLGRLPASVRQQEPIGTYSLTMSAVQGSERLSGRLSGFVHLTRSLPQGRNEERYGPAGRRGEAPSHPPQRSNGSELARLFRAHHR